MRRAAGHISTSAVKIIGEIDLMTMITILKARKLARPSSQTTDITLEGVRDDC